MSVTVIGGSPAAFVAAPLTDTVTGLQHVVTMEDGALVTSEISAGLDVATLPGLMTWLRGTTLGAAGASIGSWADQSGQGKNFTGANAPIVAIDSGKKVARFDGINDSLSNAMTLAGPFTAYATARFRTTTPGGLFGSLVTADRVIRRSDLLNTIMAFFGGGSIDRAATWGAWSVYGVVQNGASSLLSANGVETTGTLSGSWQSPMLGDINAGASPAAMDVGEVVFCSQALSPANRAGLVATLTARMP